MNGSETEGSEPRHSNFKLNITLSIGYERIRAGGVDRWEARGVTAVLLLAGVAVTVFVVFVLLPRLLSLV